MTEYLGVVTSSMSQEEVFSFLADASNFVKWDPGVLDSIAVADSRPGMGSEFDVTVKGPRPTTLRYRVIDFDPPERVVLEARSDSLWSLDRITVTPTKTGCQVVYDARLELLGAMRFANPLLGPVFRRIGARAAGGLRLALR